MLSADRQPAEPALDADQLLDRYGKIRSRTLALTQGLSPEDQAIQSMPDASPTKWHLAHTTWFFETFLLAPRLEAYEPFDARFSHLFNSYYESVGARHPRPERGMITRPDQSEVLAYRAHVDAAMERLCASGVDAKLATLFELGLNHEEQHQELILMDIKHAFSKNPLVPIYRARSPRPAIAAPQTSWSSYEGGLIEIGAAGSSFAFDNEGPRHKVWLDPFVIADRLVTCGEWLAFIDAGGYRNPKWWLSDGWATVVHEGWLAPEYWQFNNERGKIFTLEDVVDIDHAEPVCHVSFYEADAFARWAGRRLPTEAEWELSSLASFDAASGGDVHPRGSVKEGARDYAGQVWQWTASAYRPYPRFQPAADATGEYNGKFMSGQMVLRGGACVTPPGHSRPTYRNFYPPSARWAFSGVRLADDV